MQCLEMVCQKIYAFLKRKKQALNFPEAKKSGSRKLNYFIKENFFNNVLTITLLIHLQIIITDHQITKTGPKFENNNLALHFVVTCTDSLYLSKNTHIFLILC